MSCDRIVPLLGAHADGEIGSSGEADVRAHLAACPACAARHADIVALRSRLRTEVPYFRAPPALVDAVQARAAAALPARDQGFHAGFRQRWRGWLASAAAGCAATLLAMWVATSWTSWRAGEDLATEAVDAHVRATLAHHLVAVVSSDQHTVKPWLSARLDFSPPVRDFAAEGFALEGARLDYLGRRGVATLVYRYRAHVVDVFVRPTPDLASGKAAATVRGFNVVRAAGGGMDWLAVSDASPDVLAALLARLAAEPAPP